MNKHNQNGVVNTLLILFIFSLLLLIGALVFGVWAFSSRQDYKNNTDAKISSAVAVAQQSENKLDARRYAEQAKQPFKTYIGPEAYGSLVVKFPRTWSGYVDDSGSNSSNALIDGYFYPNVVPSITGQSSVFALRIQVINQAYSQVLQTFSTQQSGQPATTKAFALPKLPKVIGVRMLGTVQVGEGTKTVDMVILPLRSDTLEIWTEGSQFGADFSNYILPNFSFSP